MGYIVGGIEDFTEDHTQDSAFWKWVDLVGDGEPPLVENGHAIMPAGVVTDSNPMGTRIVLGQFLPGGNRMAQRTTIKFSKTGEQYLSAATRVHVAQDPSEVYQSISALVDPYQGGKLAISSDGGTYVFGSDVVLVDGDWYWISCTIDDTRNVTSELFDSDPDTAAPIAAFTSDLSGDATSQYATIPGTGGFIATAGVVIDEFKWEYLEESARTREVPDRFVAHESDHRKLVKDELKRLSDHGAIPALTDQSNVDNVRRTVNQILDVLRDAGLIPFE